MKKLILIVVLLVLSLPLLAEESCLDFFQDGTHGPVGKPTSYPCEKTAEISYPSTFGPVKFSFYHFWEGWTGSEADLKIMDLIYTSMKDSMAILGQYPGIMPKNIKLLYTNDLSTDDRYGDSVVDEKVCRIRIYHSIGTLKDIQIKSTLAHELFHCYNSNDMFSEVKGQSYHRWIKEGMSNYFENLVYPTSNSEWDYTINYDIKTPIYRFAHKFDQAYGASAFFQNWENNGIGLVLAQMALGSIVKEKTEKSFAVALSKVSDIANIFQNFTEQFFLQRIVDTGGGYVPVKAPTADVVMDLKAENSLIDYTTKPFAATIFKLTTPPQGRYTFKINPSAYNLGHRMAVKTAGGLKFIRSTPGSPLTITVDCDTSFRNIAVLMSNTDPEAESTPLEIQIDYKETDETLECPCIRKVSPIDTCLKGKWEGDNEAYARELGYQVNTGPYQSMTDIHADGKYFMNFIDDTDGEATAVNQTVSAIIPAAGFELDYLQKTNYKLDFLFFQQGPGRFCVEPRNFTGSATITIDGESSDLDLGELVNSVPGSRETTEATYRCDANTLTIYYKNTGRDSYAEWVYHRKH